MWILGLKGSSPNIHIQILQTDFRTFFSIIMTFRFKDENDYEEEIWFKVFFAYYQKIDSPEFFIVLFFTRKVCTVIVIEGGWAFSRLQNTKTSNIWEVVPATTTLSLKLVVEWRRLPLFPAKMTLPHARALLSIEKIS